MENTGQDRKRDHDIYELFSFIFILANTIEITDFPWRRESLARDVDKTVKMAEGPGCGAYRWRCPCDGSKDHSRQCDPISDSIFICGSYIMWTMEKILMASQSTSQWNLESQECLYGQCDQECQYGQCDQEFQYGHCNQECQITQVWPRRTRTIEQTMWNRTKAHIEKLC